MQQNQSTDWVYRITGRLSILVICIFVPCLWAVTQVDTETAPIYDWLPKDQKSRQRYDEFLEHFGSDQFVLMTWPGCNLEDERADRLVEFLMDEDRDEGSSNVESGSDSYLIRTAVSTRMIRDRLSHLSDRQFRRRFNEILIGPNGTCVVSVAVSKAGINNPEATIAYLEQNAQKAGLLPEELKFAGTVFESVVVDRASDASLKKLVVPSCLFAAMAAWYALRSLRRAFLVFCLATTGQILSIGILHLGGSGFSAFLIVLPTLVFMLGLSSAIHLVNYWVDAKQQIIREADCEIPSTFGAGGRALQAGFWPCMLASITTMVGMGSLTVSKLLPIQIFGFFTSVGLGVSTFGLLCLFPKFSDLVLGRTKTTSLASKSTATETVSSPSPLDRFITAASRLITARFKEIIFVSLACFVFAGTGVMQIESSTKFEYMFRPDSPILNNITWIENNIGPAVPIEIVIEIPDANSGNRKSAEPDKLQNSVADAKLMPVDEDRRIDVVQGARGSVESKPSEVLELLSRIHRRLHKIKPVGGVSSVLNITGPVPTGATVRDVVKRAALDVRVNKEMPQLVESGLVARTTNSTLFRCTALVPVVGEEHYGKLTDLVRQAAEEAFHESDFSKNQFSKASVSVTGLTPVVYEAQQLLLGDLISSFTLAFLLITPVMIIVLRSIKLGLATMFPNVLPVLTVFGTMGWLGISVDMASIMTASVALGIAVDDTLHFVHWYASSIRSGKSSVESVQLAFKKCARAMLQTTLICSSAMLPFFLSDFVPTAKFAKLMIAMLCGAIIGDLVILPAILLTPIGLKSKNATNDLDE